MLRLPRALPRLSLLSILVALVPAVFALDAASAPPTVSRTLDDYRHFRTVAIDLTGRAPTREEIAATERADWNLDHWIDGHVTGPGYVERLTRRLRSVSQRIEGLEDGIDKIVDKLDKRPAADLDARLSKLEEALDRIESALTAR